MAVLLSVFFIFRRDVSLVDATSGCLASCSPHILYFTKTYTVFLYVSAVRLFIQRLTDSHNHWNGLQP